MPEKMNGARLFARTLQAYGVTHVFFMDAVLRRALAEMEDCNIVRILGHSEKAVASTWRTVSLVFRGVLACASPNRWARPILQPPCRILLWGTPRSSL